MSNGGADSHSNSGDEAPNTLYKAPAPKTVKEILEADPEDESLKRYKEALLGKTSGNVIVDPSDQRTVILKWIRLVVAGRPTVELKADGNLDGLNFKIKEGAHYKLQFAFHVQREMVTGLRYAHKISKMGITVLNENLMVGSYGPKMEIIEYTTPLEEAPAGMLARGKYKVASKFTDDYGHTYAKWNMQLEISKDWE